jgi:hypothetical protein
MSAVPNRGTRGESSGSHLSLLEAPVGTFLEKLSDFAGGQPGWTPSTALRIAGPPRSPETSLIFSSARCPRV